VPTLDDILKDTEAAPAPAQTPASVGSRLIDYAASGIVPPQAAQAIGEFAKP